MEKEYIYLVEKELEVIENLIKEMELYKKKNNKRAKGSILHDFYNACERIFRWIAKQINGDFNPTSGWHKELLFKMTLEIKGIRPAVISEKVAADLNEFLQFRHLFRNIYGFELKSDLIDKLVDKFFVVSKKFIKEIKSFLKKMQDYEKE
jgi:hypothetical protein